MILAFCGTKGSGKDTCADHLVRQYGFTKTAFADPIKNVCKEMFLFSDAQCNDPVLKEVVDDRWGVSPRRALQMVGTDWGRERFDMSLWVKLMGYRLQQRQSSARVVVPDVRFPNEKELIEKMGGTVIGVLRDGPIDNHPSETVAHTLARQCTHQIVNDGTIQDLHHKIDDLWLSSVI